MRRAAIVTVARSDWGIWRPVARALVERRAFDVEVWAASAHLAQQHGLTVEEVEREGFVVGARVACLVDDDRPLGTAATMARAVAGFADVLSSRRPDVLLVLGDRFDMFAAVAAAVPFRVPVAHVHGGELTAGAIDDGFRHAITKLSHLHFTSTARARRRVIQLGERPETVFTVGAPALDALRGFTPLSRDALAGSLGRTLPPCFVLVTFHPETLALDDTRAHIGALLDALRAHGLDALFTAPNADPTSGIVRDEIARFVTERPGSFVVTSLGSERYWSAMHHAAAVVGNSSSGIIEAPTLRAPVVNVGRRQDGRERAPNVVDCEPTPDAVTRALTRALDPAFKAALTGENPYDAGGASVRIAAALEAQRDLDALVTTKRFFDIEVDA